ncbi:thioesterase family protein [Nocardia otitidiscaviarum]|uniref:thioesterase family protein n=1 Tax=Nocardia otitidiscaviarum TaxID=1823 RepID=UPI0018943F18|nr:acyl-CoA thioesterase domain-containing protein [Nocardia otitidiscaviarum]MBF6241129.1 thioesterase family protein [Nocardia otitidiscaviarum]
MTAFFTVVDGRYRATEMAESAWSARQLAGTAVCGLLAREAEFHAPAGFLPARFTADLFRPVLNEPIDVRAEVVRDGNRVRVVDTSIVQHGTVHARASVMYLAVTEPPPGQVWEPTRDLPVPARRLAGEHGDPPLFKSGSADWTGDFASGRNSDRKSVWHNLPALVDGEPISPFQRAAFVGDATNLVCNWGTDGVGYINSDVTVTLARLPEGHEVGLQARDHVSANGIVVATATMYDRHGPLGTAVITGISNARRQVDMAAFAESRSIPAPTLH